MKKIKLNKEIIIEVEDIFGDLGHSCGVIKQNGVEIGYLEFPELVKLRRIEKVYKENYFLVKFLGV